MLHVLTELIFFGRRDADSEYIIHPEPLLDDDIFIGPKCGSVAYRLKFTRKKWRTKKTMRRSLRSAGENDGSPSNKLLRFSLDLETSDDTALTKQQRNSLRNSLGNGVFGGLSKTLKGELLVNRSKNRRVFFIIIIIFSSLLISFLISSRFSSHLISFHNLSTPSIPLLLFVPTGPLKRERL